MMNQKGDFIKKACFIGLVLFAVLGFMSFVGCSSGGGDGGGGGGGGAPAQTFTTSNFFPLTSGWETDRWTLFVDVVDHDINGIMAKVMVDTRGPKFNYWTNDANGLRLHGSMDEEEGNVDLFSEPIVFADSICKLGDKKEGTVTIEGEEVNYSVEIAGVEDVTVPAGTFANCLKFMLLLYPSADLPSNYGYETLWLAENVGFVKAEAEDNADIELFADAGDTRQLLSYHVTDPAELSNDQRAVREAYIEATKRFNAEDLDGMMSMVSEDFLDEACRDKDDHGNRYWNFFNSTSDHYFFTTIEDISIDGDIAYILREGLNSWIDDATFERIWNWDRVFRPFRRENGEWKYYGAQLGFRPIRVDTWIQNDFSSDPQEVLVLDAELIDCTTSEYIDRDVVSSFTVTGPPGTSIDPDFTKDWLPDDEIFWRYEDLANATNGFYTFAIEKPDGNYYIHTDYLEATPPMDLAVLVSPAAEETVTPGDVTFDWDPVANAEEYRVDMQQWDGSSWTGYVRLYPDPLSETFVIASLDPSTEYRWRVRARQFDLYGNMDNESRTEWREFETGAE